MNGGTCSFEAENPEDPFCICPEEFDGDNCEIPRKLSILHAGPFKLVKH